jgi:O-methyltransferase
MLPADQIMKRVRGFALTPEPVVRKTIALTRHVLNCEVEGDFVECGVFAGVQVGAMALAAAHHPALADRKFHLFDSFTGIPEAGPNDTEQPGIGPVSGGAGRLVSTGVSACSRHLVEQNLRSWGIRPARMVFHEGWFQYTVPEWPKGKKIALLRLDGDLYASTLVCFEYLYPELSDGGVCIVDDCNLAGCLRAVSDYFGGDPPERSAIPGGDGCEWWVKAQSC